MTPLPYQLAEDYTDTAIDAYKDAEALVQLVERMVRRLKAPGLLGGFQPAMVNLRAINAYLEGLGYDPLVSEMGELVTPSDIAAWALDGLSDHVGEARSWLSDNGEHDPYAKVIAKLSRYHDEQKRAKPVELEAA